MPTDPATIEGVPIEVWAVAGLAALPLAMTLVNLLHFRKAPKASGEGPPRPSVSVLIPARDEAEGIAACVRSVLASEGVDLEVRVLDDHSTDGTGAVVREIAAEDRRVALHAAPSLPEGWNGKQHACFVLSTLATHDRLLWIDADVRLEPDALRRALAFQDTSRAPLVSGFPRQLAATWLEKLLIPLIQVVLLGYLPMGIMRRRKSAGLGAGCGQFFLAERSAYERVGGHAAVKASMHDGVTLPRAFRKAGFMTDLFDASDVASCRMYAGAAATWRGLAKNATEGMAGPGAIGVWTALLMGGWVAPWALLAAWAAGLYGPSDDGVAVLAAAATGTVLAAGIVAVKCRQSLASAAFIAAGMGTLVAIQWYALGRKLRGVPSTWRGRAYAAGH